jgi:hypothetical protein
VEVRCQRIVLTLTAREAHMFFAGPRVQTTVLQVRGREAHGREKATLHSSLSRKISVLT